MSEGSLRPTDVGSGPPVPRPPAGPAPEQPTEVYTVITDDDEPTPTAGGGDASSTADRAKEAAKVVGNQAKDAARDVADVATGEARHTAEVAAEKARETAGEVRYQAHELFDHTKATVVEQASAQQDRLAGTLGTLAGDFSALADGNAPADSTAAALARDAARYVGQAADWLESRTLEDVLDEVSGYARRHPGRFLLIATLAGFVAGRVVRGVKDAGAGSPDSGSRPVVTARTPSPLLPRRPPSRPRSARRPGGTMCRRARSCRSRVRSSRPCVPTASSPVHSPGRVAHEHRDRPARPPAARGERGRHRRPGEP